MTAMPPTTGHLQLIQFASLIANTGVEVIINTQPHEPFVDERAAALKLAVKHLGAKDIVVKHISKTIEQKPQAPGFWKMWQGFMKDFGATSNDYIVASEVYGKKLAEIIGAKFFPYDIDRALNSTKASVIRDNPIDNFANIIPEFQPYLRTTITVFGAESTGKTTLSRQLAREIDGQWLFEYARPYLENTVNDITTDSMTAIWQGQKALQKQANNLTNQPFVIQDTDLFSTVGYWQFPHWQKTIGKCPTGLIDDAIALKSDLYIITKSNIPFEKDPLRYGGDVREGSDEYWIDICKQYNLPYVILDTNNPTERIEQAKAAILKVAKNKAQLISYDRKGL